MSQNLGTYPFTGVVHDTALPGAAGAARHHRVVIVGGGPVGLTLALSLALQGVASVVVEADRTVCVGSRAICISRRSLQIFQRLGVLDSFLKKGLPWIAGRSFYRDEEVLHFSMPHDPREKLPPMLNIEQFYIEQFLLDAVEKYPDLIEVQWGTRASSLETDPEGATVTLENDRGTYSLTADWLVACDGGQSFVRNALGLQLQGTSYEGRYIIADIKLDSDLPTERLAWFDPPSNPGSSVLMHRQPDNVWRVDYQVRQGEDVAEAIKPENVIPRIRSHLEFIGETGEWSPIWITMYKTHALSLETYRHGRVLFAGDAAHLVPIFGVRGANSGIDDADNLGWKLASVIKGVAADRLLDTYSDERIYATSENLSYGRKSTEFMAPPSFAFEQMRKAVLTLASRHPEVRPLINPRQSATIHYVHSPLNAVESEEQAFTSGPKPGAILAECPVVTGRQERACHLTDLIGHHFTLLHFTDRAPVAELAALATDMAQSGVPFNALVLSSIPQSSPVFKTAWDASGALADTYDATEGTSYLLRPDGHVLGRWRSLDIDVVQSVVSRVLSRAAFHQ